ncbi:peptidoglycan endopeptidase [uncultured Erythrobacter sp.]|uniref:peptidoglycan endopeptidase n=1 Tax=uncultured Erythrobacter sp. TaxID=263913 RepID=UPI002603A488|nr:peptidoglycan endopeptidase [uncultured Erythrobacter sp.]
MGVDCVGLVYASLVAIGRKPVAPEGYRIRNADAQRWFAAATLSGFAAADGTLEPGDLILIIPSPGQQHLMIVENLQTAIHAHAGLRRVVRQTMATDQEILAHWRLNPISERKA